MSVVAFGGGGHPFFLKKLSGLSSESSVAAAVRAVSTVAVATSVTASVTAAVAASEAAAEPTMATKLVPKQVDGGHTSDDQAENY